MLVYLPQIEPLSLQEVKLVEMLELLLPLSQGGSLGSWHLARSHLLTVENPWF
jgi:hypothetical protein